MRHVTFFVVCALLAACGVTTKEGTCKDYVPAASCPADHSYECQTTKQGCKQCTCVRNKNHPEVPGYDD